jgi:6-phosphogluconate dehydrogenase
MSKELCELGVIGLSTVGQSLAAHHASDGIRVCVSDEDPSFVPQVVREYKSQIEADAEDAEEEEEDDEEDGDGASSDDRRTRRLRAAARCMIPSGGVEEMVPMLKRPRRIVVCGTHGRDATFAGSFWDRLFPLLEEGDVVLRWGREDDDGGGECDPATPLRGGGGGGGDIQFYDAATLGKLSRTQARPGGIHLLEMVRLAQDRLLDATTTVQHSFLVGGGSREAYSLMEPLISSYGASIAHVGNDVGCVHYAFMIQRTIENGISQVYAEGADILRKAAGYEQQDVGRTFKNWNESVGGGGMSSYLTGISSRIYYKRDTLTKTGFVVDHIIDSIVSDPVDTWATLEATRLGVPAPTINAAQETRFLSVMREERMEASAILKVMDGNDTPSVLRDQIAEDLQHAMFCACLFVVAECLSIFEAASEVGLWDADVGECVRMWKRPGSFLESTLMDRVHTALEDDGGGQQQSAHDTRRRLGAPGAAHVVEEDSVDVVRERHTLPDPQLVPHALRHVPIREVADKPDTRAARLLRRVRVRQARREGVVQHVLGQGAHDSEEEEGVVVAGRGRARHEEEKNENGGIVNAFFR